MNNLSHARISRRTAIQAGAIGLLGLGENHLHALRAAQPKKDAGRIPRAQAVIYIFLSGGLAQQDSFDLKPDAPDAVRGEFKPIATRTPGIHICEHLPMLAKQSNHWALVRSLTHPYNEHSQGHMAMLTGRTPMPRGFDPNRPKPSDWPSITSIVGDVMQPPNNLPPAVVLPERLIHRTGRVIPGQSAGTMGARREPWFVETVRYNPKTYGAYPDYEFHHNKGRTKTAGLLFQAPSFNLPSEMSPGRFSARIGLLERLDKQRAFLDRAASVESLDRHRQSVVSLLTDGKTRQAFDVESAGAKTLDRYGRNSFGKSLLLARRLVESGVSLIQVHLGNDETWDTHESAFPNLKNYLFPPTDRAVSALIEDLQQRGMLDSTLIVMAGEFGRTPKVFSLGKGKLPGRDHWGSVQTVFFAGGGVHGGNVIGKSDKIGGHPATDPQQPENMAATIYQALGIPATAVWHDEVTRPNHIYFGRPIKGLSNA